MLARLLASVRNLGGTEASMYPVMTGTDMPPVNSCSMMHVLIPYTFLNKTEMMPMVAEKISMLVNTIGLLRP